MVLPDRLLIAPYGVVVLAGVSMRISNAKARSDLVWKPKYPSHRAAPAAATGGGAGDARSCGEDNAAEGWS